MAAADAGPVGRDDVVAQLRRSVDEAVAGRGQVLLLAGEAGIGKTTMLADAVAVGLGGSAPLSKALAGYHRARDRAAKPMYDFTTRLAAIAPPSPAELALFQALARSQPDADRFIGALTGTVPLREFMAPGEMVRLVGVRGFAKLVLGQARRGRPAAGQAELVTA